MSELQDGGPTVYFRTDIPYLTGNPEFRIDFPKRVLQRDQLEMLTDILNEGLERTARKFRVRKEDLPVTLINELKNRIHTGQYDNHTGELSLSSYKFAYPNTLRRVMYHELGHSGARTYVHSDERKIAYKDDTSSPERFVLEELPALANENTVVHALEGLIELPRNKIISALAVLYHLCEQAPVFTKRDLKTKFVYNYQMVAFAEWLFQQRGPRAISRLVTYGSLHNGFSNLAGKTSTEMILEFGSNVLRSEVSRSEIQDRVVQLKQHVSQAQEQVRYLVESLEIAKDIALPKSSVHTYVHTAGYINNRLHLYPFCEDFGVVKKVGTPEYTHLTFDPYENCWYAAPIRNDTFHEVSRFDTLAAALR